MTELTLAEQKTLSAIVLTCAEEPFTAEKLERACSGLLTGFEAELGIERLRRRGIVETRRKAWGETFHMLSSGLFAHWQRVCIPALDEMEAWREEDVEYSYEPAAGFGKLLLFLLADAANEGIAVTQKGMFHKKDLTRLHSRIKTAGELLEGLEIACVHPDKDKLGKPLAVLYDAALRLGLLCRGSGKLDIVPGRLEEFLALSNPEIDRRLQQLWWEVYTPPDVWLQHAAAVLQRLPVGEWYDLDSIAKKLRAGGVPTGGRGHAAARDAIRSYWAAPMAAFGWLELGEAGGKAAVRKRVSFASDGEGGWYVQPDLEIIVPEDVPFHARWVLEACAEYIAGDTVDRYKITKDRWEQALAREYDAEFLLSTLRQHAVSPLPESVEAALRQWSSSYGALAVVPVTLLRCKNAEDAAFLSTSASLKDGLVEQIGDRDFIIKNSEIHAIVEKLKRQGFSVKAGGERAEGRNGRGEAIAPEAPVSVTAPQGIVTSRRSAALFPLDPAPSGMEALRARLAQVPQGWIRQLRKYHASTMKDMIETAIDIRTSIKLVLGGRTVEMTPKQLRPAGGDWVIQGYIGGAETSVHVSEFEEVQLIVPEHA